MAAEYLALDQQISLNSPVTFYASIPCRKGLIYHEDGSGVFILRGAVNNPNACFAQYQIVFNGNIAIPTGGAVTPIAVSIVESGEPKFGSLAITTPAAVEEFGNVTSTSIVKVPRGCCFTVAIEYVSGVTDGTTTPTPSILLQNGNLTINRIA